MFLEPIFKGQRSGWIEVICGSMFSGKTEELLRRIKRAKYANQTVVLFKPSEDTRYSEQDVVSHDANAMTSIAVGDSKDILRLIGEAEVIGIDEAQFFDAGLTAVCEQLALDGKRVIIAGLDMDYKGVPFGPMPNLLAVSEYITKVHAICLHCGNLATHSYRLVAAEEKVLLGAGDEYEPRCRKCNAMGNILDFKKKRS